MKIRPDGADLIHEDRLGEFAKSPKNKQMGLYDTYCLNTIKIPFIGVRSESLHRYLYGTVRNRTALTLDTIKHNTVLKPNIPHYDLGNSKATSSLGYILRQNAKLKEKYIIFTGHAVAQSVEALRYKAGRSRVRFPMVSLEFFIDIILPAALWP